MKKIKIRKKYLLYETFQIQITNHFKKTTIDFLKNRLVIYLKN